MCELRKISDGLKAITVPPDTGYVNCQNKIFGVSTRNATPSFSG